MGAQLSRIGAGRGMLVVFVCAVLSLTGLTRSGIAGDDPAPTTHAPVVLAPPKVDDPDLGSSGVPAITKKERAAARAEEEGTKTCLTALGQRVKVLRSFHCPKVEKFSGPAASGVTKGKPVTPPAQNGGTQSTGQLPQGTTPAPKTQAPARPKSGEVKPTPKKKLPVQKNKPQTPAPNTGGTATPD